MIVPGVYRRLDTLLQHDSSVFGLSESSEHLSSVKPRRDIVRLSFVEVL